MNRSFPLLLALAVVAVLSSAPPDAPPPLPPAPMLFMGLGMEGAPPGPMCDCPCMQGMMGMGPPGGGPPGMPGPGGPGGPGMMGPMGGGRGMGMRMGMGGPGGPGGPGGFGGPGMGMMPPMGGMGGPISREDLMKYARPPEWFLDRLEKSGIRPPSADKEMMKLQADVEVKEAELRRLMLEDNARPEALKAKLTEIASIQVEIRLRDILSHRQHMKEMMQGPRELKGPPAPAEKPREHGMMGGHP